MPILGLPSRIGFAIGAAPIAGRPRTPAFSDARVAQLVEHVTENHGVGGSIPSLGTITLEVIERLTSVSGPSRKYGRTSLSSGDQDT